MKGLILINGYPSAEKFLRQSARIQAELCALGIETDVVKNGEIAAKFSNDGNVSVDVKKYGFAVYLDKDKYLGEMLEVAGLRLFNPSKAVETCDDKMRTFLALKNSGLRFPDTVSAPLCYTKDAKVSEEFLENVAQNLGFPLVVKKSYGSFGAGVRLVHGMSELQKTAEEFLYAPHFFQEYIKESCGRDIRVIVIGQKALGGMERVAKEGEFRSNIELGGVGRKIALKKEYAIAAERAAKALGLDYCGVDLLQTKEGPVLCEVNSNAFFEGFEEATGLDIAKTYAEYIVSAI